MKNVLFLCTGNSCRSQMAEGWGRHFLSDKYEFYSAGTKKHGMNPYAIKVMQEVGVDISSHTSNTLDEYENVHLDIIITVCSDAHESCPLFPRGEVHHVGFEDPPRLVKELVDEDEILAVYRRVRDEIKEFIINFESRLELV